MLDFKQKVIKKKFTLGEIISEKRCELGYSLKEVSEKLNIQVKYLEALEEANYDNLPNIMYTINFLRVYLKFLNLSVQEFEQVYKKEHNVYQKIKLGGKEGNNKLSNKYLKFFYFSPKLFKTLFAILFIAIFVGYIFGQTKKIFLEPFVHIYYPPKELVTYDFVLEVKGETEKEAIVKINEKQIFLGKNGFFKESISLQKGINVIKISSTKKYSKENVKYRKVMVKEK